jgi:hypothetical protein
VLLLILAAVVVVWAGALLDFKKQRAQSSAKPQPGEPEATPSAQPAPLPVVASRPKPNPPQPAQTIAPPQMAAPSVGQGPAPSPVAQGPLQVIGKVARTFLTATHGAGPASTPEQPIQVPEATGELGEGVLSPEYTELERHYVDEPRDGEWSMQEEQRIRELLHGQPLSEKVALVNCQQTVCRIVLETGSNDAWQQLLQVPGLAELTKLTPQSPYSLRSGQLSVYFHPGPQAPATKP